MADSNPHHLVRRSWRRLAGVALPVAVIVSMAVGPAAPGGAAPKSRPGMAAVSPGVLNALAVHRGEITPRRGSDRAPNGFSNRFLPNVKASNQGNDPVNESPITADPSNGTNLLSGGNDYNCSTIQGFYTSSDGGKTWPNQHCLAPPLPGKQGFGDPNVVYDTSGNAYILGINASGSLTDGVIVYQKSSDNGATWSATTAGPTSFYPSGIPDKPWTEADQSPTSPFKDCMYTSITQFDSSFNKIRITVDHSCDGGATWNGPVGVSPEQIFPDVVQFSDLAVAPDGTVYVSWIDCRANGPVGDCGDTNATVYVASSADGGDTWSAPVAAHMAHLAPDSCFCAFYGNVPTTSERTSNIPVIDVDDNTGDVYVADYHFTGTFMQVRISKSVDGGMTWGAPVPVNASSISDQFLYWLSVSDSGKVGVTYLHRTGPSYRNYFSLSKDGGATWKGNRPIASEPSLFVDDGFGGSFMGDYNGSIWTGNTLHASWTDTRTGTAQDWTGGAKP